MDETSSLTTCEEIFYIVAGLKLQRNGWICQIAAALIIM